MNIGKIFMFISLLIFFIIAEAAEMVVTRQLYEVTEDLTLRESPRKDLSGNNCALVKISTDLVPFDEIESSNTPVDIVNKTSEVWVYLSAGDSRLYFDKQGFARLNYELPVKLKEKTVYYMTIMGKGVADVENVVTLTFNISVEGVVISREGKAPITANSTVAPFRLPRGKYNFIFEKQGYLKQTREIDLQKDETVEISMKTGSGEVNFTSPGIITIESDPEGADVELNGQKVGTTPYQGSHYAGEYTLTLRKDLYHPSGKNFTLKPGETLDIPAEKLKPRFGYYEAISEPTGAEVYLDDKLIGKTPLTKQKIASGNHTLRLTLSKYKTYQEEFIIKDGDEKKFNNKLAPNYAPLEINSAPEQGATVYIDDREVGKTPYSDPMMQAGTYTVRVEKELWSGSSETIIIVPENSVNRTLILTKDFGTLIVNAPEAKILLNGEEVATGRFERKLKPGNYTVTAVREKHKNDEKSVFVSIGETVAVDLNNIPRLGSVSVLAVEKRNQSKKINGADIFINGVKNAKQTPAVAELLYGDYQIMLKHSAYLETEKSVTIKEGESQTVTFEMDTYSGSLQAKRNSWSTQRWISFSATALLAGGGLLCNMQANSNFDKYETADNSADARSYKKKTEDFENYRNYCYYTASGTAIYTLYSWIKTAVYSKKL